MIIGQHLYLPEPMDRIELSSAVYETAALPLSYIGNQLGYNTFRC